MRTASVDLAAYLHLSVMDPDDIEFFDARGGRPTRMFCYRDSEMRWFWRGHSPRRGPK